jgi:hypothetical protein
MPGSRKGSKWARIPVPPAGARFRGYMRYSERDRSTADKHTLEMQRREVDSLARSMGWICTGWDEEPAISGAAESIEQRPAFSRHLAAAEAGEFDVSLVHMSDRWARDTEIALHSLKRLRRAGVYWATADGKWDINRVIEDGHSMAFVVDAEVNAAYARKSSQKAVSARAERAEAGYHNGRVMWGYMRAPAPARPEDALYSWRAPREPARPHPENFLRLQQIGEWSAAGISDREVAQRCAAMGWPLVHRVRGRVPWSKTTITEFVTNPFPREYRPGGGLGTIRTPDGRLIEGKHIAAWSFDLAQRMDEMRIVRRKGRTGHPSVGGVVRIFSGLAICAACGRPLHHQPRFYQGRRYSVYMCASSTEGFSCPMRGWKSIRSDDLSDCFADLALARPLPVDWRERILADLARKGGADDKQAVEVCHSELEGEREQVLFQHRHRIISDERMLTEVRRIDEALAQLPRSVADSQVEEALLVAAGETLARHRDYWDLATLEEQAEIMRLLVRPYGLAVDIPKKRIARFLPRELVLPVLRLALPGWHVGNDGWLEP